MLKQPDKHVMSNSTDMRIVALSDQHGYLPEISPCDLLIVAGDVCPDLVGPAASVPDAEGQKAWFDAHARPWLSAAPAAHKILTWGNHDFCGQAYRFEADSPAVAPTIRVRRTGRSYLSAGSCSADGCSTERTPR